MNTSSSLQKNTGPLSAELVATVCKGREDAFKKIEPLIPIALRRQLKEKIARERAQLVAFEARRLKVSENLQKAAASLPHQYFEKKQLDPSLLE
jgi:hypothetical protein